KPVIAFDRGGIAEMVSNGVEGMLVDGRPPDIEGLATACLAYLRNPARRTRDGYAARRRIELQFDARQHAAKLQDLFFQIATSRKN
ncbi:glycosyltransferase, partial [Acinetobacter baumannii]